MKSGTKLICGIDDAGRGPVIGPMVLAGAIIEKNNLNKLKNIGAIDSKLLTPKRRETLYKEITKITKHYKIITSPAEIDKALNSETSNLNKLEAEITAKIINKLKPDEAIIDCPSNNIPAWEAYLKKHIKIKTRLTLSHKAERYPIVAAASIIAKVTRDKEIEKIKKKIGIDFGSGYPSDPITQKFLKKHYKTHKQIFRTTWETYKRLTKAKKQKSLGDF